MSTHIIYKKRIKKISQTERKLREVTAADDTQRCWFRKTCYSCDLFIAI